MTLKTSRILFLVALVGLSLGASLAFIEAQEEDDQPLIDYRHRLMAGQRASMG